ncbi:RNA polymerase sigma factor [Paenibacillus sanfengchensis]|uniref:RNA polymerase sigma factor n=1 Tax=Paenibacillus sanfengchensis TaxID=3119819 RepID=UPI002FE02539
MADFEEIYRQCFREVYRFVYSLSRNEELSEEITQETFFKALKGIDGFKGNCKLSVWLCQIAKHTYFSHLEKQKRFLPELCTGLSSTRENLEDVLLNKDETLRIHRALHRLKEPYKEVFSLTMKLSMSKIRFIKRNTAGTMKFGLFIMVRERTAFSFGKKEWTFRRPALRWKPGFSSNPRFPQTFSVHLSGAAIKFRLGYQRIKVQEEGTNECLKNQQKPKRLHFPAKAVSVCRRIAKAALGCAVWRCPLRLPSILPSTSRPGSPAPT